MTSWDWGVALTAVAGIVGSAAGFLATRGLDAWKKYRTTQHELNMDERKFEAGNASEATRVLVETLKGQVATLAEDLKTARAAYDEDIKQLRQEHTECIKNQGLLEGRNERFESEIKHLREEVKGLRDWRHGLSDPVNAEVLKKHAAELLATQKPPTDFSDLEEKPK